MTKSNYSGISMRAATITGGLIGFLFWLFMVLLYGTMGFNTYGALGYMMGGYAGSVVGWPLYIMIAIILIIAIISGAIAGAVIGWIYNWAITLK